MLPGLSASTNVSNSSSAKSEGEFGDSTSRGSTGIHGLITMNVATGQSNLAQSQTPTDTSGFNWQAVGIVAAAGLALFWFINFRRGRRR